MIQGTYVTYAYKKSIKHLQMEDVILQQKVFAMKCIICSHSFNMHCQMELRNLKKLRMRDCNRINDFRSELSKKKQLVEQFQVAIEIMEKRMKLMEEKYEKINDHAAAKVIKLLQDRLSDELGKEFSQEFSEYKVIYQLFMLSKYLKHECMYIIIFSLLWMLMKKQQQCNNYKIN